jgi:hypothetical protein
MTTDLSYVVKQSPAAPKLPILPVRRMVPLEPNIINFPPIGAQQAGSAMSALEERHRSIERPEWARSRRSAVRGGTSAFHPFLPSHW